MDVRIVYYSRSGTTEGLVKMVAEEFRAHGHDVSTIPVKHEKKTGFLRTGRMAMKGRIPNILNEERDFDLGGSDMVVLGSPIFAWNVAPWMRAYMERASGLQGKAGGVIITCGSPHEKGSELVELMVTLAREHGLEVRAKLVGSVKDKEKYGQLARSFVEDVLGLDTHEIGGDDGGDDGDGGNGDGE